MNLRTISMEDAGELDKYLPLSFKATKEQEYFEICLNFDLASIADRPETDSIRTLHEMLKSEYGSEE